MACIGSSARIALAPGSRAGWSSVMPSTSLGNVVSRCGSLVTMTARVASHPHIVLFLAWSLALIPVSRACSPSRTYQAA